MTLQEYKNAFAELAQKPIEGTREEIAAELESQRSELNNLSDMMGRAYGESQNTEWVEFLPLAQVIYSYIYHGKNDAHQRDHLIANGVLRK